MFTQVMTETMATAMSMKQSNAKIGSLDLKQVILLDSEYLERGWQTLVEEQWGHHDDREICPPQWFHGSSLVLKESYY